MANSLLEKVRQQKNYSHFLNVPRNLSLLSPETSHLFPESSHLFPESSHFPRNLSPLLKISPKLLTFTLPRNLSPFKNIFLKTAN